MSVSSLFRHFFFKPLIAIIYRPFILWYLKSERNFSYKKIKIKVFPGVFHPGFFFSTNYLLSFLENISLENKLFLELGCGTALISIAASKKNAKVTAIDISDSAIENAKTNSEINQTEMTILKSDLFKNLTDQVFDIIVINPPYYPKKIHNNADYAWFCGEEFQYFTELFSTLNQHIHSETLTIMVWSEDSDIQPVIKIATEHNFDLKLVDQKKVWFETNYIFQLRMSANS